MAADDAVVGIEFHADPGNVRQVSDQVKAEVKKVGEEKAPEIKLEPLIDAKQLDDQLQSLKLRPLVLDVAFSAEQVNRELEALRLRPLQVHIKAEDVQAGARASVRPLNIPSTTFPVVPEIQPGTLKAEVLAEAATIPPLHIPIEPPPIASLVDQLQAGLEKQGSGKFSTPLSLAGSANLPEFEAVRKAAQDLAAVGLDKIKTDLNGILHQPGLAQQAQGYSGIVAQLRDWHTENGHLLGDGGRLDAVYHTLTQSAEAGLSRVADRTRSLADLGQQITLAFAGVGTLLGGAAVGAVQVASNFEQLQQRLITVTGSADAAKEAFEFDKVRAAASPYDLEAEIEATAQLHSFRQEAEKLLPVVENLAAERGKSLQESALVFAKAAAGGAEGFESLHNDYGIITRDLLEFGAVEGKVAGQLSHAEQDIDKNRDALVRLIQTNFGGAVARQSQTLTGAMSALQDAVHSAAASFGETLIPSLTSGLRTLTSFVDFVSNTLPTGSKQAIAGIVAIGGAIGIMGAGLAAGVTGLLLLQAQLLTTSAALNTQFPAAAAVAAGAADALGAAGTFAAGGMASLGRVLTAELSFETIGAGLAATATGIQGVGAAALGLATGPVGVFVALAAAIYAIKEVSDGSVRAADELGQAVTRDANAFASAAKNIRDVHSAIDAAGKGIGVAVDRSLDGLAQLDNVKNALSQLSAESFVQELERAGISVEQLKTRLEELEKKGKIIRDLRDDAQAALAAADGRLVDAKNNSGFFANPLSEGQTDIPRLQAERDEKKRIADSLTETYRKLQEAQATDKAAVDKGEPFAKGIADALAASKELAATLDLSKQVGTTKALSDALANVQGRIEANAKQAGVGTADLDKLLEKQKGLKENSGQQQLILQQIALIKQASELRKSLDDQERKAVDENLRAQEQVIARKKALGELSSAQELALIEKELQTRGISDEREIQLIQIRTDLRKQAVEAQTKSYEDQIQRRRALGQLSADDELRLLHEELTVTGITEEQKTKIYGEGAAAHKRKVEEEIQREQDGLARRKALGQSSANDELLTYSRLMRLQGLSIQQQLRFLEGYYSAKKRLEADDKSSAEKAFKALSDSVNTGIGAAKATGDQSKITGSIEQAITRTNAWRAANAELLAQYPEIATALDKLGNSLGLQKQTAHVKLLRDNMHQLGAALGESISKADNPAERLATVDQAIKVAQKAAEQHVVDQGAAENYINERLKERASLQRQVDEARRQSENAVKQQAQNNRQQELEVLQTRKDAGDKTSDLDQRIAKVREGLVKGQLDQVQSELEASRRKGEDEVSITALAAQKREAILQAETLRRFQENRKQEDDLKSSVERQLSQFQRLGGKNSPLMSAEEAFGGPGAFSLPGFGLSAPTLPRFKNPVDDLSSLRSKVNLQFDSDKLGRDAKAAKPDSNGPITVIINGQQLKENDPAFHKVLVDGLKRIAHRNSLAGDAGFGTTGGFGGF